MTTRYVLLLVKLLILSTAIQANNDLLIQPPKDGKCPKVPFDLPCSPKMVGDGIWAYDGKSCAFYYNLCDFFRGQCIRMYQLCEEQMQVVPEKFCVGTERCKAKCPEIDPRCIERNGVLCTVRSYCDLMNYICQTGEKWQLVKQDRCLDRKRCNVKECSKFGPWHYYYVNGTAQYVNLFD